MTKRDGENGYLYLMWIEEYENEELFKIGKTDNIDRRISEHQRIYKEAKLINSVKSSNYHNIEIKIISVFNNKFKLVKGREFFKALRGDIVDLFNTTIEQCITEPHITEISLDCEYCNKKYTTKGNLTEHQRTVKYCLQIQEEIHGENSDKIEKITFNCDFCEKIFSQKSHLSRHIPLCLEKYKFEIKEVKANMTDKDNEIINLKLEIAELRDKFKTVAYKTEIRILREQNERSTSTVEEIAKQPKIQNNYNPSRYF
jgi:uncharacterized Zn-finger protein